MATRTKTPFVLSDMPIPPARFWKRKSKRAA